METEIIVLAVSHYDMTDDGGSKGASVRICGGMTQKDNYFGLAISESEIPYSEIDEIIKYPLPAKFKVIGEFGVVKKNGSKKEVTTMTFSSFKYLSSLQFTPVKSA